MNLYQELINKEKVISVIGLGYVGLPVALAFASKYKVIGFDYNPQRVALMQQGVDPSKEIATSAFAHKDITFTSDPADLKAAHFHIVAVPTPIDNHKVPDLDSLFSASEYVGMALKPGDYVVYESTVYPGCTEEDCLPILEKYSGLQGGKDFKIGYSPERINPGDKTHTLEHILKIVAGCDAESLEVIADVYGSIITAGIYKATTIKVAEAAKVIENTQRDLNISLMNELAVIFDQLDIDTREVIEAAGTKWNFIKMYPGLVGGHCIGVDPYYLIHKALDVGIDPQVIRSGRWINDQMPGFIAKKLVQTLLKNGKNPIHSKILVMGLTFKENVSDTRNTKVVNLIQELEGYAIKVDVYDPHASAEEVFQQYGIRLIEAVDPPYNAIVVAVNHREFEGYHADRFMAMMPEDPVLFDIKGMYDKETMQQKLSYWRL